MIDLNFEPPTNQQEALYQGFALFFTPSKASTRRIELNTTYYG